MTKPNRKQIAPFWVPTELHEKLQREADEKAVGISTLIKQILVERSQKSKVV